VSSGPERRAGVKSGERRVIGVAGGLGPYAHIEFERALLRAAARRLCRPPRDQDFPDWVVSSIPRTPDRTQALCGIGGSPVPALRLSLTRLAAADADFAVIPCNTAHAFIEELAAVSPLPLLDMIAATIAATSSEARQRGAARVGLLATDGTLAARIFHRCAERWPQLELITLLDLDDGAQLQERLVMTPIYGPRAGSGRVGGGIKSGVFDETTTSPLRRAVERLADQGATAIICGCTEIPLVLGHASVAGVALIDPLEVAAERAVELACGATPLPGELLRGMHSREARELTSRSMTGAQQ
jgi:aspartate racemase